MAPAKRRKLAAAAASASASTDKKSRVKAVGSPATTLTKVMAGETSPSSPIKDMTMSP
jgi:hypothetical protein